MFKHSWIFEGEVVDNKTGTTYKLKGVEYDKEQKIIKGDGRFFRVMHEPQNSDVARIEIVKSYVSSSGLGMTEITLEAVLEDYTLKNCGRIY